MKKTLAVVAIGVLALAGCGDDDKASEPTVTDAWARTSPGAVDVGAAYMDIESPIDDQLTAVTVDSSVAGRVEIHETVKAEDDSTESTMAGTQTTMGSAAEGDMGAMTMRPIPALDLPAGETVVLEPGGYHLMLLDLPDPLAEGETFDATLEFAEAEPVTVTVTVRDAAP